MKPLPCKLSTHQNCKHVQEICAVKGTFWFILFIELKDKA
jgi:hypothetical protein